MSDEKIGQRDANIELGIRVRSCSECPFHGVEDKLGNWEAKLDEAAHDLRAMFDLDDAENREIRKVCERIEHVSLMVRAEMMGLHI